MQFGINKHCIYTCLYAFIKSKPAGRLDVPQLCVYLLSEMLGHVIVVFGEIGKISLWWEFGFARHLAAAESGAGLVTIYNAWDVCMQKPSNSSQIMISKPKNILCPYLLANPFSFAGRLVAVPINNE